MTQRGSLLPRWTCCTGTLPHFLHRCSFNAVTNGLAPSERRPAREQTNPIQRWPILIRTIEVLIRALEPGARDVVAAAMLGGRRPSPDAP